MKETYNHYDDGNITICTLEYDNIKVYGIAECSSEDQDMKNDLTGEQIAYFRAICDYYTQFRKNKKLELKGIKQYYYSINKSKRYNPDIYAIKMLKRQISKREKELEWATSIIEASKQAEKTYIEEKDKVYQAIRKLRANKESDKGKTD